MLHNLKISFVRKNVFLDPSIPGGTFSVDFNLFGVVKKKLNMHLQYQQLNQEQQQQQQQKQQLQQQKFMKQNLISHLEKMAEVFYRSTKIQVRLFFLFSHLPRFKIKMRT